MRAVLSTPRAFATPDMRTPAAFASLAAIISLFPLLVRRSRFAFMPGPGDVSGCGALPLAPLPACLTRPLRTLLPTSVWLSNPGRIRWCAQDVVLFRADVGGRLRRACVRPPTDAPAPGPGEPPLCGGQAMVACVAATLLQQGHLSPLPLPQHPVFWQADHTLWLHPQPHALIIADRGAAHAVVGFEDVACCSPGCFGEDGAFAIYRPNERIFELSVVN